MGSSGCAGSATRPVYEYMRMAATIHKDRIIFIPFYFVCLWSSIRFGCYDSNWQRCHCCSHRFANMPVHNKQWETEVVVLQLCSLRPSVSTPQPYTAQQERSLQYPISSHEDIFLEWQQQKVLTPCQLRNERAFPAGHRQSIASALQHINLLLVYRTGIVYIFAKICDCVHGMRVAESSSIPLWYIHVVEIENIRAAASSLLLTSFRRRATPTFFISHRCYCSSRAPEHT